MSKHQNIPFVIFIPTTKSLRNVDTPDYYFMPPKPKKQGKNKYK